MLTDAKFLKDFCDTTENMYRLGWDERNGGNISLLLTEEEVAPYVDVKKVIRTIPLGFEALPLAGKYFLVTGTGKYFKNVKKDPENNLGLFRVAKNGKDAELIWGYADGGRFTSEMPAHLMSHMARLSVDPANRIVMHTHPTNLLAMTFVHECTTEAWTETLWKMNTESIVVFPEGVEVLPWEVCGTNAIGEHTAEAIKSARVVVWTMHGIYGAGRDFDEVFGLIETVEKACQLYLMTAGLKKVNTLTNENLMELVKRFDLKIRHGIID